ncbi:MAG: helix-turn-helix domain containing protein [Mycobacterium kyogaense]|uniref:TetR/AcrR family transcriptional regulator n=1 Tax=Mycobacterium kyogaense TaxID=2212479 RepID=UPI002FF468E9
MTTRAEVDAKIAAATLEVLRTRGPRAVTVEAVTARSGVAKTTIYRRYSDRRDMLAAALSSITTAAPLDAQTDPRDLLAWVITHAVDAVEGGIGFGGFAALLTDDDPDFTEVFRRILAEQRATLEAAITQTWTGIDPVTLIDAIVGAYTAERARTGAVADGWQDRLFDVFWLAVSSG